MFHVVEFVLQEHPGTVEPVLEEYLAADVWARHMAEKYIDKVVK